MDAIKMHLFHTYRQKSHVSSIVVVAGPIMSMPLVEGTKALAIIVMQQQVEDILFEYVEIDNERIVVQLISKERLSKYLQNNNQWNNSILEWLLRGEILLDTDQFWANTRKQVLSFPEELRDQKRFQEFVLFLQCYVQAKQFFHEGHVLDAYSKVLLALHHWAHIVLIEEGIRPELAVWKQLKHVHPGVYKLYEELSASPESMEQRVQLVLLACEFTAINKLKGCCTHLFKIMKESDLPWSISQLQQHPSMAVLQLDLAMVFQKLVQRAYVEEVAILSDLNVEWMEIRYKLVVE
ncbi:nucleotidyltransferase-like protein [Paenibacillus yanchengensis]|uniref:Nucleotidyltransferase-like protein n=1 Tax=Paenibacillus yanchengensis TaxID=2035833 RepID=A0ABW4YJC8_9BACL